MNTPEVLSTVRKTATERREARQARRQLARDLAEYRTPAERRELDAMLARYPLDETLEVHRILARKVR
jgi:hypothetical protein